jgi:hypothetical protein
MQVGLGKVDSLHRLAAVDAAVPGVYTLVLTKTGDPSSVYANFPPLQVVVVADKCKLSALDIYTVPIYGRSLPIVLDFYRCLPLSDITFSVTFSSAEVSLDTQLSTKNLTRSSLDGRAFFVAVHAGQGLAAGATVTMTITVGGTNAAYYDSPITVTLSMINNSTASPTASSVPAVSLSGTTATFSMQCSQPSTMYWALGLFPSLADLQSLSIQTNLTNSGNGLVSNRSRGDLNFTVYGVSYSVLVQPLTLQLPQLRSNSRYQLTYFCVNQMGLISPAASTTFTTPSNGGYLLKVNLTFAGNLTASQYNQLACAMAVSLACPADRLWTQLAGYCSTYRFPQYADSAYPTVSSNSAGQYSYGFYVVPDYAAASDTLNTRVLASLSSLNYISTLLGSVSNAYQLPSIVSIVPQSVLNTATPKVDRSRVFVSPTAMALYLKMTNANGYILAAVLKGSFLPNYALPSAAQIKAGILTDGISFQQVKSLYLPIQVNQTLLITGLEANTSYALVIVPTVDDPTFEAASGVVEAINFTTNTLNAIVIYANFAAAFLGMLVLAVA